MRRYKLSTVSWDERRDDVNSVELINHYYINASDPSSAIKQFCCGEDKFPDPSCFLKIEDVTTFALISRLELEDKVKRGVA